MSNITEMMANAIVNLAYDLIGECSRSHKEESNKDIERGLLDVSYCRYGKIIV